VTHLRNVFDDWTAMNLAENHEKKKSGKVYKK
jgi:hypothetical protein